VLATAGGGGGGAVSVSDRLVSGSGSGVGANGSMPPAVKGPAEFTGGRGMGQWSAYCPQVRAGRSVAIVIAPPALRLGRRVLAPADGVARQAAQTAPAAAPLVDVVLLAGGMAGRR
jgi:hypothetical protein